MVDLSNRLLALIAIIILLPLFAIISILILITSGRPVLFKQARAGKDKKPFQIIKFRTMVNNAEEIKQTLSQQNEAAWPFFKMREDPRITKIGKLLRRTSLDELPQLFNILKGDMSIIGPRPVLISEADIVTQKRFSVKPGLTGPTQIYRNKKMTLEERNALEEEYINTKHLFATKLKIFLKTFVAMFKGE